MEDKPKTNQVMDIQPPRQPDVSFQQPEQVPAQSATAPEPLAPSVVQETASRDDAQEPSINDVQEAPADDRITTEDQADSSHQEMPILAATAQPVHKNHVPVFAIVCALTVSGVLAALTVFSFSNNDQSNDSTATPASTIEAPKVDTAKPADVDTLNAAIDQDLQAIDEASDYSDAAVSDTTLGL